MKPNKIHKAGIKHSYWDFKSKDFKKNNGQNILNNSTIIDSIVKKAEIQKTDVVLEIGPGTGNLTVKLLAKAKRVIAVELDPRMLVALQRRVQRTPFEGNLSVFHRDIMKIDLPYFDICVANIPFHLSSPLTFKLLYHSSHSFFRAAVIMYQLEFAMRLVAQPGDRFYCRLSANVELMSKTSLLLRINKNNFRPPPKVDSGVVCMEPKNPLPSIDFIEWDGLTRFCFLKKNKTLGSIFRQNSNMAILKHNSKLQKYHLWNEKIAATRIDISGEESSPMNIQNIVSTSKGYAEIKELAISILKDQGLEEMRSLKMKQEDFLRLLAAMNAAGIYFTKQ